MQINTEIRIKTVLSELTDILNGYLLHWNSVETALKSDYESLMYQKDVKASYADINGEFEGEIVGVQDDGRLLIQVQNEMRSYSIKEIQFSSK